MLHLPEDDHKSANLVGSQRAKSLQLRFHWPVSAGHSHPAATHHIHQQMLFISEMDTTERFITILLMPHDDGS